MIISLALPKKYNIDINKNSKVAIDIVDETGAKKTEISIKEIPFLRYRFGMYGSEEVEYIKNSMSRFTYSAHMIEVMLDEHFEDNMANIAQIDNVIVYCYISLENSDVDNGISSTKIELMEKVRDYNINRFMIKDNTTNLYMLKALEIKKQISNIVGMNMNDIGVCSSPLSFEDNNCCLSALKARELLAKHVVHDTVSIPTANHQCMNSCGCIRYYTVKNDLLSTDTQKERKDKEKNKAKPKQETKKKSKNNSKILAKWR